MSKLALLLLPAAVLAAGRSIQLPDYYRIETAATPAISPDGRWVVFARSTIVEADNAHHTELWVAPADASSPATRLTTPAFNASAPRWSPDGKLLSFSSTRRAGAPADAAPAGRGGGRRGGGGGESDIWFLRMDRPSGEAFQIPGVEGAPVFSPDNRWIAFTRRTAPPRQPRTPTPLEAQLEQRFKGRIYDWMNARFDGRGYLPDPRDPAVTPPNELYIVSRDGGTPRQITRIGVDVREPAWRPDSAAIAFIADTHQRDEYSYERADLFIATLDGNTRGLTDDGFEYDSPTWSPDGKTLVFRRHQSLNQVLAAKQNHGAAVDVYRMTVDDSHMWNLTPEWDLLPDAPAYSPDGKSVYFAGGVGGDTHLFREDIGSGRVQQLTRGERSLGGFSFSQDFSTMSFTAASAQHPAEAFAAKIDGTGEHQLSTLNNALLQEVDLASAERIHFPSKDGTQIEGWVMLPRTGTAPYPMILSIHGGPHGAYGSAFNYEFQWLAANGYAVLFTNPRGSTGYGEKFLWGTWGGWGKLDLEDVLGGVDYAIAHYRINPKRLGVTGYSYGGFLTNWTVTQTDRFAAAVTGAGVVNWVSDYGTADIPRTKESEFLGSPWQSASNELMRSLSPITYANKVKTPILFLHGESDMRVPIEEAEQFYTALKKLKVPTKFVRYPGNYHGGWPPWDMVHRYYQEAQWWKEFLQ